MFLERKFLSASERHARRGEIGPLTGLPERVDDVARNIDRLLAAERSVSHVLPDYGLSHSGQRSLEGVIAHATAELRETLARYEPRLALADIESELDDDGRPRLLVRGQIGDTRVTLIIDPLARRILAVRVG